MLRLSDFYHLPQLDEAAAQIAADGAGLIVVSGLDARPAARGDAGAGLPSGRTTVFRMLIGELMGASPTARGVVVAERADSVRIPSAMRDRMHPISSRAARTAAERIAIGAAQKPDLLVVDMLDAGAAEAALEAARSGVKVIGQIDSIFRGAAVARHLRDLGVAGEKLDALAWVIFVQRLPTLCADCRRPAEADSLQLALLPHDSHGAPPQAFHAPGCPACGGTGRRGDVAVFDIFRFPGRQAALGATPDPHVLPIERYARALASEGLLALGDALDLEDDQLRRTYQLLNVSERALAEANGALQRKLLELEAANRVLGQHTRALISLQDTTQTLFATTNLPELQARIWRAAGELAGADRAVLYWRRPDSTAEVWGLLGWDADRAPRSLPAEQVFRAGETSPAPFSGWPPGIEPRHADVEGATLLAGLRVPIVTDGHQAGVLIVHSTRRRRFEPSEVALIQTFASQAALALERAELFSALQEKVDQLEAAQAALVERERLEREMELAHEVQQRMLPQLFPPLAGYRFAAVNRPARQVGGDLYDVFKIDEDRVGLVIADVSGKGMPAALYMALTRSLILAEARREPSPRDALASVNHLLRKLGEPHMFVTVFYGVLHGPSRELTFARAGHDYPLIYRGGGTIQLGGEGTVLGFFASDELRLSEERVLLEPGDRLVLYTDGLTDIVNPQGRRIELPGLREVFSRHAALPPEQLIAATFADLGAFQGEAAQYDDMTMLVVAVDPPA